MHEYEFRLVVQSPEPWADAWLLEHARCLRHERVLYVKPHFRFRDGRWETKRKVSARAVYHEGFWFSWVHSVERPFEQWSRTRRCHFLHRTGNFQDPFRVERRRVVDLDGRAKLYTFQGPTPGDHRLVFEWEYGAFPSPQTEDVLDGPALLRDLAPYRRVWDAMRGFPAPPREVLQEDATRKPVTDISRPVGDEPHLVFAHKADGIFGIVYSYRDRIKEKWEDYEVCVRRGTTLGEGLVFAAERLEGAAVLLLDVYQVGGQNTAWCRRAVLMEWLPQLYEVGGLPNGYQVQRYYPDLEQLPAEAPFKTDGWIAHDVVEDKVYKWKLFHSIDLLYSSGYFWAPHFKFAGLKEGGDVPLEEGCVYEIATGDGRVVRKREDRHTSNTKKQILHELSYGWGGPYRIPIREETGTTVPQQAKKRCY